MLEVRNLVKSYKTTKSKTKDRVVALNNVSITFPETGLVFLLGKSGSGKSTLLNAIGGLDSFDSGEIIIKGKSSRDFSQSDFDSYRNTFIGFIFQEYNVLEEFTVAKNLSMALELQGKKADKEEVNKLLEQVEMLEYAKRKPNQLSGGQKQRVAIARALIKNPEIIMADEPTGALDSNTGKQVMETLKKLSKEKLVIIVSHDREFAEIYGDRIIELKDGKIISDVTKKEVAPVKTESGISIIDDKLIHIKKGTSISGGDMQAIAKAIAEGNKSTDIIISIDEKSVDQMKKISSITDEGNREIFTGTEKDDIKTKEYDPKDFKLIRSRLHFKDSLKMGASALKSKVAKLVFTIILSFISFAMFGLVDTLAAFNRPDAVVTTIEMTGDKQISLKKESKGKWSNSAQPITDDDLAYFKEKYPDINIQPVVNRGIQFGNSYDSNGMTLNIKDLDTSSNHPAYQPYFSGMIDINQAKLDELGFTLIGRLPLENGLCSDLHKGYISGHNDTQVYVIYDDCNPFGMIAGYFGEITNLSKHTSQTATENTINSFNLLSESFSTFMDNFTIPTDGTEYKPTIDTDKLNDYTDFYNYATQLYNSSLLSFTRNANDDISRSAVVGTNHPYTMIFGSDVNQDSLNLQEVVANLYGFDSVTEFTTYAQDLANTYGQHRTNIKNSSTTNAALDNGCFYTEDESFVFPIAINNDTTSPVLTYVIVDTNGLVSVWVNNIADALWATNFNSSFHTESVINNELYCKNTLFVEEYKTQVCISKHLYNCYKNNNSEQITSEQDFLYEHNICNLSNNYYGGSSDYQFKIVGIIDDHSDLTEFYEIEKDQLNTMNGYMLQQKIRSVLDYGYASMIYCTTSHYNTYLNKKLDVQGYIHNADGSIRHIYLNNLGDYNTIKNDYYNNIPDSQYDDLNYSFYLKNNAKLFAKNGGYQLADDEIVVFGDILNCIDYTSNMDKINNNLKLKLRASSDSTSEVIKEFKVVGYYNDGWSANYKYFIANENVINQLDTSATYYLFTSDGTEYLYNSFTAESTTTTKGVFEHRYGGFNHNIYFYNGQDFTDGDINLTGNQIILPADYVLTGGIDWEEAKENAKDIVKAGGYTITIKNSSDVNAKDICTFEVVGLSDNDRIYISEEYYNKYIKTRISGYDYIIATLTDNARLNKNFIKACEKFNDDDIKFTVQNGSTSILDNWGGIFEDITSVLIWVALGFAVFASLMLMSFISTSISYKKREIGILRALGARSSDVFGIFFKESLIIALINFVLAFTTTAVGAFFINRAIIVELGIDLALLTVSIRQFALILGISILAAFIASILPVSKISRKKPIDAINNR